MSTAFGVKGIILLDTEGNRIVSKYYVKDFPMKEQKDFEKKLFNKTANTSNEIIALDSFVIIYRPVADVNLYVMGGMDDNETMLDDVLNGFQEAFARIIKNQVDKRGIFENLDTVFLLIDEMIDEGLIFETDPLVLETRVALKHTDDSPLSEQSLSSTWKDLNKHFMRFTNS